MIWKIENLIEKNKDKVDEWFKHHESQVTVPFYTSVDLRDAGFKISVVDTNVFPGGFNNLCQTNSTIGSQLAKEYIESQFGGVQEIVIIPESHTRNKYYLQNLYELRTILENAGFQVTIGTITKEFSGEVIRLETQDGQALELLRVQREGDHLVVNSIKPDLIIMNNDLSDGPPEELVGIEQPITPPIEMGWYSRTKHRHVETYNRLVSEFAEILNLDPWLMSAITRHEKDLDFKEKTGMDRLAAQVDAVLEGTREKYEQYDVRQDPYVFVKDNSGTYGRGIITAASGNELLDISRSRRNKMDRNKGGNRISQVIIQEGIPTKSYFKGSVGEPVIYLIGSDPVGGFFRFHAGKGDKDNLNSPGMGFTRVCFSDDEAKYPDFCFHEDCVYTVFGALARIAVMAAGYEMKALADKEELPDT